MFDRIKYNKKRKEKNKAIHDDDFYKKLHEPIKCGKCKETKESNQFHKSATTKTGFARVCKACSVSIRHEYYLRNKEKSLAVNDKWRKNNIEATRLLSKKNYAKTKESRRRTANAWYKKNKEKIREQKKIRYLALGGYEHIKPRVKKYREKNKESINEYSRELRKKNPEKYKEYSKKKWHLNKDIIKKQVKIRDKKRGCTHSHLMMINLSDGYVRGVLCGNNSSLKAEDIPDELIQLKRAQLQIYREIHK